MDEKSQVDQKFFNTLNEKEFQHSEALKLKELICLFGVLGCRPKQAVHNALQVMRGGEDILLDDMG